MRVEEEEDLREKKKRLRLDVLYSVKTAPEEGNTSISLPGGISPGDKAGSPERDKGSSSGSGDRGGSPGSDTACSPSMGDKGGSPVGGNKDNSLGAGHWLDSSGGSSG